MRGSARARFGETVLATEALLDARCRGWRGRLVHVSSLAVYGFNQLRPGATLDETTPLEPDLGRRDDYAWTKALAGARRARLRRAADIEVVVVRPGAIYGAERTFQQRLGRRLGSRAILLIGGRNRIPLSYVANTASLLVRCADAPARGGADVQRHRPRPAAPVELPRAAAARRGSRRVVVPLPLAVLRLAGAAFSAAERRTRGAVSPPALLRPYVIQPTMRPFRYAPSRAHALLGWEPPVGREEALKRTMDALSRLTL